MNQFDRHVLCTIARLARGITIEIPPTRKEPISEKLRELPGTLIWRNRVPELFLTLEYRKSPDQEQLAGAVVSMHGRGLIVSFRDRLLLPDEECRYQCLTGLRSLPDVCRQRLRPLARRETTDRS